MTQPNLMKEEMNAILYLTDWSHCRVAIADCPSRHEWCHIVHIFNTATYRQTQIHWQIDRHHAWHTAGHHSHVYKHARSGVVTFYIVRGERQNAALNWKINMWGPNQACSQTRPIGVSKILGVTSTFRRSHGRRHRLESGVQNSTTNGASRKVFVCTATLITLRKCSVIGCNNLPQEYLDAFTEIC